MKVAFTLLFVGFIAVAAAENRPPKLNQDSQDDAGNDEGSLFTRGKMHLLANKHKKGM